MQEEKEKIKLQHIESYKKAIIETIKNNTNSLIDDDIMSLIKKPPLDSMDQIKSKFLDLAKKNKIIVNSEELDKMINNYRDELTKCCEDIKNIRITKLTTVVEDTKFTKDKDVIKLNKSNFTSIDKEIRKIIKEESTKLVEVKIISNIEKIFNEDTDLNIVKKVTNESTKYLKNIYLKQLLENIDIKILVKDTTLINSSKEQAERYLFTINNSRLFDD